MRFIILSVTLFCSVICHADNTEPQHIPYCTTTCIPAANGTEICTISCT